MLVNALILYISLNYSLVYSIQVINFLIYFSSGPTTESTFGLNKVSWYTRYQLSKI